MNIAGTDSGGRTGPYWRRQLGTTLPGERTGQELALINNLRRKAGLPPLGGAVGEDTKFAQPGPPLQRPMPPAPRRAMPAGPLPITRDHLRQLSPGGDMMIPEQPAGVQPGVGGFEGELPNPQQGGDLRQVLLARMQGMAPHPVSRDALLRYVQQAGLRNAQQGPARPILPPRKPLRQARPY